MTYAKLAQRAMVSLIISTIGIVFNSVWFFITDNLYEKIINVSFVAVCGLLICIAVERLMEYKQHRDSMRMFDESKRTKEASGEG